MKVAFTQVTATVEGVVGVVLRSGPRFAPESLARTGEVFTRAMRDAAARVAAGEPEAFIDVDAPVPGRFAAAAYLEKYGPHGRYDWVALLDHIAVPTLIILGGADPSPLVRAAREEVERRERPSQCEVRVMPTWTHGFDAPGDDVAARSAQLVVDWWVRLRPTGHA